MNTDLLLLNICKYISLNDEENARILRFLEEEKVTRNSFILKEGEIFDRIYFVNSGILRAYSINPDGKEATVKFAVKDCWRKRT